MPEFGIWSFNFVPCLCYVIHYFWYICSSYMIGVGRRHQRWVPQTSNLPATRRFLLLDSIVWVFSIQSTGRNLLPYRTGWFADARLNGCSSPLWSDCSYQTEHSWTKVYPTHHSARWIVPYQQRRWRALPMYSTRIDLAFCVLILSLRSSVWNSLRMTYSVEAWRWSTSYPTLFDSGNALYDVDWYLDMEIDFNLESS